MEQIKTKRNPLLHIVKKQDVSLLNKWIIRLIAIGFAFILCASISTAMGGSFSGFFTKIINACFINLGPGSTFSSTKILDLLESTIILLLIALALVPAFKMKYWNIGAEGQIAAGILVCAVLQKYLGGVMNLNEPGIRFVFFVILFAGSICGGALWAVIPAIFKAKFKTNETLFTLMMNYIALILTSVVIKTWSPDKGTVPAFDDLVYLPKIGNSQLVLNIIIGVVVAVLIFVYLKFTKHGYEISVVGGSRNTARYIGINVNKVTIRTMLFTGAVCGLIGCLLLSGEHNNLTSTIVSGRGFTGVLIAWISGFGAIEISLYSFLCAFITKGSRSVNFNVAFPNIMLGICFFTLIACEFFITYQIRSEKIETFFQNKFPKLFNRKKIKEEKDIKPQLVNKEGK